MPSHAKPPKIQQNKPQGFKETMAATMPGVQTSRGLSGRQLRYGLYVVWVSATIIAGIAVGLLLANYRTPASPAVSPTPVAATAVNVAPTQNATIETAHSDPSSQTLQVTPAYSITQAGAGTPLITTMISQVQPSADQTNLLPGYATKNNLQGAIGTDPVSN